MSFELSKLRDHPYATGGIVIVGALVVYYLLSSRGNSGASTSSNYGAALSADTALGQAQTAAAIQTNAQQAAITQAQIQASSQNQQTSAAESVANTGAIASLLSTLFQTKSATDVAGINANAATLQAANAGTVEQNVYALQEQGLQAQINAQYAEQANNNATNLSGLVDTLNAQGQIATQVIGSSTQLATQAQNNFQKNVTMLAPSFGKQYNSALDANNAAAEIQTVLSAGNPNVAAAGVGSSTSVANGGNAASASIVASIANGASSVAKSLVTGFFG